MFEACDENGKQSNVHHLAEMTALLGPAPNAFLQRSKVASKYWDEQGQPLLSLSRPPPQTSFRYEIFRMKRGYKFRIKSTGADAYLKKSPRQLEGRSRDPRPRAPRLGTKSARSQPGPLPLLCTQNAAMGTRGSSVGGCVVERSVVDGCLMPRFN